MSIPESVNAKGAIPDTGVALRGLAPLMAMEGKTAVCSLSISHPISKGSPEGQKLYFRSSPP